ncbi:hypothetical protein BT96DRAFT_995907 [Gymnopus androsaceus JB14]|uniref:Retrovirus-related Pol polyprotein from transposon TNT 1-94-like beta-barrel domain-containing protein n=1 Tax=Gymnopus androsaceus JB14 TaxID=1447944 RepID=A0A6A4HIP1_9AGAR|nr:hypothetical protein BT96DRAFT_995907 [Gymnopus androsaceus JB14]
MLNSGGNMLPFIINKELKLCGHENYKSWKQQMLIQEKPRGLNIYWEGRAVVITHTTITTTPTSSTPTTTKKSAINDLNPSTLEFELCESVALSSILGNIIDIDGARIKEEWSSNKVWKYLEMRTIAKRELPNARFINGTKVAGEGGYIEKLQGLQKKGSRCSWDVITTPLHKEKELETIITDLTIHGKQLISQGKLDGKPESIVPKGDSVQALHATIAALQADTSLSKVNGPRPRFSNDICSNTTCPQPRGHTIQKCWSLGGGIQRQYPAWWKGKQDIPLPPGALPPSAHLAWMTNQGGVIPGRHYALMAKADPINLEAIIHTNKPSIDQITMITTKVPDTMSSVSFTDSGATTHFFKSCSIFTNYKEVSNTMGLSAKEGTGFHIAGSGNVSIRVIHNGEQNTLTFRDALHTHQTSVQTSYPSANLIG